MDEKSASVRYQVHLEPKSKQVFNKEFRDTPKEAMRGSKTGSLRYLVWMAASESGAFEKKMRRQIAGCRFRRLTDRSPFSKKPN